MNQQKSTKKPTKKRRKSKCSPISNDIYELKRQKQTPLDGSVLDSVDSVCSESESDIDPQKIAYSESETDSVIDPCPEADKTLQNSVLTMSCETPTNQQPSQPSQHPLHMSAPDSQMHVQPNLIYSSPIGIAPQMMHLSQAPIPQPQGLSDSDVVRIATQVKMMLTEEIDRLVTVKVQHAVAPIQNQLQSLIAENADLKHKLNEVEQNMLSKTDELEQYSRRQCLRVSGIKESPDEDTTKLIMDLSEKLKLGIKPTDIDRSHRVGRPSTTKTRDIIVKVSSYGVRLSLLKGRAALRTSKEKIFINED